MINLINQINLYQSLKAIGLGMIIGGIFEVFKIEPPSQNNILGLFGIAGLWLDWSLFHSFLQ